MRTPFRRKVLNPGGEAVLIRDTSELASDELLDIGGGRTIRVADLLAGLDEIPVHGPEVDRG